MQGNLNRRVYFGNIRISAYETGGVITVTQNCDFGTRFFGKLRRDEEERGGG
jgi:hypothetical protein